MRKYSPKFSGTITPLNAHMLAIADSVVQNEPPVIHPEEAPTQETHSSPIRTPSPNDFTPTDEGQTSGGDEGDVTLSGLLTQVEKLKLDNTSQATQILLLKRKVKKLFKMVKPVVTHHRLWIKSQSTVKKKSEKKGKKRSSSSKLGRKSSKDKESLDKEDSFEGIKSLEPDVVVTGLEKTHPSDDINWDWEPHFDDFQRSYQDTGKKDESTGFINQSTAFTSQSTGFTTESTAMPSQSTAAPEQDVDITTPTPVSYIPEEDIIGPSEAHKEDATLKELPDEVTLAEALLQIGRTPGSLSIPGVDQQARRSDPSSSTLDPKDKGKGIMQEDPKKKKLTPQ